MERPTFVLYIVNGTSDNLRYSIGSPIPSNTERGILGPHQSMIFKSVTTLCVNDDDARFLYDSFWETFDVIDPICRVTREPPKNNPFPKETDFAFQIVKPGEGDKKYLPTD